MHRSTPHLVVGADSELAALASRLTDADDLPVEVDGRVVAHLVGASRVTPYVGLFGNHPFEVARRRPVATRDLRPEDFAD